MYFLPGTGGTVLTHPHFPKLPTAELLHKFQRLPWDLPLVLCPGPLGNRDMQGAVSLWHRPSTFSVGGETTGEVNGQFDTKLSAPN